MKIPYKLFIPIVFLLVSCGGDSADTETTEEAAIPTKKGGVFRMSIGSFFKCVQVNEVQKHEESQVYWQIFEGLVKYNSETLKIEPSLAKSWEISPDGLIYTFVLRDSVFFHDNPCFKDGKGRLVTSEDVLYSFKQIYDPKPTNTGYSMFKNTIKGGNQFHDGEAQEIEGIKINGNEITIELEKPSLAFIQKLASVFGSIIAKEATEAQDFVPVGTGPFFYDNVNSTSSKIRLANNKNYYGKDEEGNKLPYLDSTVFVYFENSDDQMELFWDGSLSYVSKVPITKISEVLEEKINDFESKPPKYILISEPELTTTYLELNMQTQVLKNLKVRQALNLAIDREKLVSKILKNQAYEIGKFGLVPPLQKIFETYDFEGVEDVSYTFNSARAKELLAEAGYPDGKNFPSLEMQFKAGSTDYLIASEIQSQLRSVLNINIDIEAIEFNDLLENKAMGDADIFRTNWVGDYTSAEAFLANAYGKFVPKSKNEPSYINSSRYQNSEFDKLFELGANELDPKLANKYFSDAEKLLMQDAAFIILWYNEDLALKQAALRDFGTNSIGYIDLKRVFFRTPTAEEYANK